jgi:hypothetical protein
MLNNVTVRIVDFSARYRWPVIVVGSLLMVATACFDYARFTITTDVHHLIFPVLLLVSSESNHTSGVYPTIHLSASFS